MKIIECPRDAMQGIKDFVPTDLKIAYINSLLEVGFDTIDFGSFVSPKAIPQMSDTKEVLHGLHLEQSASKLLAIVANMRGAEEASQFEQIQYIGFPLSISETFQQRNTKKSIQEALATVAMIQQLCVGKGKLLVVYISMGFGNPYGEVYDEDLVLRFIEKLDKLNISIVSLADTIGSAEPIQIERIFHKVMVSFPHIEFGAHFHATSETSLEKIEAAYQAGCRRLDGAIGGMGGCPMAKDDLTGNIATEKIISFLESRNALPSLNLQAFEKAIQMRWQVFS